MEYIIFLLTIQCPFLYLIWRLFQSRDLETRASLRAFKKQNEHIANFMDTLRMSVEKISEDIYGRGKVNARMFQIEKEAREMKKRLNQMELYTGLNSSNKTLDELSADPSLKEKDFS